MSHSVSSTPRLLAAFGSLLASTGLAVPALAQSVPPGESPAIFRPRVTQAAVTSGLFTVDQIRLAGMTLFTTPFNRFDGFGDGPMNHADPTTPGGRPTLQNNGTFLRINGLDAQTCQECHSIGSNAVIPFRFAIGGVGGASNNAMALPRNVDVSDRAGVGFASFDGRFINPPFLFGSGGVELLGKEMTEELQALAKQARANPGQIVQLLVKGVSFGSVVFQNGQLDTSQVEGVDEDLVVRPFGRKGEFQSARAFDIEAMQFHFGMQPVEVVGQGVDGDNDGVTDEVLVGELSALHVFDTNLERPFQQRLDAEGLAGRGLFQSMGCADCHMPQLDTTQPLLPYSFPEIPTRPFENVYLKVDLNRSPAGFDKTPAGGLAVPLFSDLKRHDMGVQLAESTGGRLDRFFITARLWGIADTAPYLHDGRASTLSEAIEMHGGEAQAARNAFMALQSADKVRVLTFLRSLRTPTKPAKDLLEALGR